MAPDLERADDRLGARRDRVWWHLAVLLALSVGFESLFVRHGLNRLDEAWPLYAAMQLWEGGVLYQDVFFVFPPGHALAAWIAWGLDPPGVIGARVIYAGFAVVLCLLAYLLGRLLMPKHFAFLGAALLAVAAPHSHLAHYHFGYRYLALCVPALLFFAKRISSGDTRWMLAAGLCLGVAVAFRLTPAFSMGCALGVGILAISPRPQSWLRDSGWLALGIALPLLPVLLWLSAGAGLERVWLEAVVRPVAMVDQQSAPFPELALPEKWDRLRVSVLFVAVQYRAYALLYVAYLLALGWRWLRARREGRPFEDSLLLALVVFGAVYFTRSFSRSDQAHLESTIPPTCLLLAHALSLAFRESPGRQRRLTEAAACVAAFGAWIFLLGSDRAFDGHFVGTKPFRALDGATRVRPGANWARILDNRSLELRTWTEPGDVVLDLTHSPIFHVLTGRRGPGYADVVMPATFLDEAEEEAFVARLEREPPALAIWPALPFDKVETRSVETFAPRLAAWVRANYEEFGARNSFILMRRKSKDP